jgi:hypothetical protein
LHKRLPLDPKEQLSHWHEDFLSKISVRLENVSEIGRAASRAKLDHRCHPSAEWLWRLHQISNEIWDTTTGYMADI